MKLRNKKTGEIGEPRIQYQEIYIDTENHMTYCYKTLRGMFEEWEDYDEPKEYYYIYANRVLKGECDGIIDNRFKEIGNYFETEEEAEKAVEKLKAWKRLKDKCCISFSGINRNIKGRPVSVNLDFNNEGKTTFDEAKQNIDDLMLLFGGEE